MFEKIKELFSASHPETKASKKKSNNEVALEVLLGKWGSGATRKKKLTKAGYNYDAVQKIVNDRMKKKSIDTVAHEVIDGKWGNGDTRKKCLEVAGYNYKTVQNKVNEILNPPKPKPSEKTYIGQACKDYDHKAGDSSGKEVCKSEFKYNESSTSCYNWTYVFRPKDAKKAEKAASMMQKAIANNAIGYSKKGETEYGKDKAMSKLAKAVNYDLSKITTKCGCSCGDIVCLCNHYAGLSTCYIGKGLALANKLKTNSNFECIKYKKGMTLKRGDTIITAHSNGKDNHVAMVL